MNQQEIWKLIPSSPNYMASNLGNIKRIKEPRKGMVLKLQVSNTRYKRAWDSQRKKWNQVHICVAQAFLGERPKGYDIDHIDKNRLNNCVDNLRYCTHRENMANMRNNSKYGVGVSKPRKGYETRISINNKVTYIGTFDTPELARKAYSDKAIEITKGDG